MLKLKRGIAYALLATLLLLVSHFLLIIDDPTRHAIASNHPTISLDSGYWLDPGQQADINALMQQPMFHQTRQLDRVPWAFKQQTYWLRLTIRNTGPQAETVAVHFANPMLEQLTVYEQLTGQWQPTLLGWQSSSLTPPQRGIPAYDVVVPAGGSKQLAVSIATEGIAKTPVRLYLKDDFSQLVRAKYLVWGAFVGILLVMSLFNLVLYAGLRDGIYLVYIGYILSVLMMLGVVMGFGHYLWPESLMRLMRSHIVSINLLVVIFTMSFALLFFNLQAQQSRVNRWFIRYLTVLIGLAIASLFVPEYIAAPIFFVSMALLYPLIALVLYQQLRLNLRWARFYMASWLPLIAGGALQPMVLTGVVEESFLMNHALMIGVLCEIVLMAMALANRMQFKKETTLFNATHHSGTRLPNGHLLEQKIAQLHHDNVPFSVVLIEVAGYQGLQPYISLSDSHELILMVSRSVNREVLYEPDFMALETRDSQCHKVVQLKDGLLAMILLAEATEPRVDVFHSVRQQLSQGTQISGLYIAMSLRIGFSAFGQHQDPEVLDVIKQAQQALAQARTEPDGIARYQTDQAYGMKQRLSLAASLQAALRSDALQLYHQPQINLKTGQIDGSEALLRWQHHELGHIPPTEFIPLAEDTGIINELTLWVVDKACQQLNALALAGYSGLNVSVNISGKDIADPGFLTNVKAILAGYRFPLHNLTFELTESVTVSDFSLLKQALDELAAMGVRLAIDDYGTGYSSLFYLAELPFTEMKIDKSFVIDLDESPRHLAIVRTTVEMARSLGLTIVAEGIENAAVEALLKEQGCDLAQGFYYQKPVPFELYLQHLQLCDDAS